MGHCTSKKYMEQDGSINKGGKKPSTAAAKELEKEEYDYVEYYRVTKQQNSTKGGKEKDDQIRPSKLCGRSKHKRIRVPRDNNDSPSRLLIHISSDCQMISVIAFDVLQTVTLHYLLPEFCQELREPFNESTTFWHYSQSNHCWAKIDTKNLPSKMTVVEFGFKHNDWVSVSQQAHMPEQTSAKICTEIPQSKPSVTAQEENIELVALPSLRSVQAKFLTITYSKSKRQIEIEFNENDTVGELKTKTASAFSFESPLDELEIEIDSVLLDNVRDDETLKELHITPGSTIDIVDKKAQPISMTTVQNG